MTDTILCVDIGTSSLKAALLSDNYKSPFVSRQILKTKTSDEWIFALKNAVTELCKKNPDYGIEAICISGNGPTLVSDDGTTLLYNESSEKSPFQTKSIFIPRLFTFKNRFTNSWKTSTHIFSGPEYLTWKLTGKAFTILPEERYSAAYWTPDELSKCGFTEEDAKKLPPFKASGSFAGQVNEEGALSTGLLEGTLVFLGAPDFVSALIGTGTIFPGKLCDRAGTSEGLNLCTTKPVTGDGLRTLPSPISGIWNVSYLMKDYDIMTFSEEAKEGYFTELSHGMSLLRMAASEAGELFPSSMTITGGQAIDKSFVAEKGKKLNIKIRVPECTDAELVGNLILARTGLGDYDDIEEASFCLVKIKESEQ